MTGNMDSVMDKSATYFIQVEGTLAPDWSERLGGMHIETEYEDTKAVTTLTGRLVDEAALLGVLNALYGMRLPLLTVKKVFD